MKFELYIYKYYISPLLRSVWSSLFYILFRKILLSFLSPPFLSLGKLIVAMNTSSRVGQCATVFSILSLFNYPLNKAACPPVCTLYSCIMPSEEHDLHTFACSITQLCTLNENKINTI